MGNVDKLSTVHQIPVDGVFFYNIQGRDESKDTTTTLLARLSDLKQYRDPYYGETGVIPVVILTDNQKDKAWVQGILRDECATQSIVVDTLKPSYSYPVSLTGEKYGKLVSRVILFIIPQAWGEDYIKSLKYKLYLATIAKDRLEFLLPWNPQRQDDLARLKRTFLQAVSIFVYTLYFWLSTEEVNTLDQIILLNTSTLLTNVKTV